jgi:hypothetical protein
MGKYFGILIIMVVILFGLERFNFINIPYVDLPESPSMYLLGTGIVALVALGRRTKKSNTK